MGSGVGAVGAGVGAGVGRGPSDERSKATTLPGPAKGVPEFPTARTNPSPERLMAVPHM